MLADRAVTSSINVTERETELFTRLLASDRRIEELESERDRLLEEKAGMAGRIELLERQVEELTRKAGLNSTNSSKPPSSDGLRRKPRPTSPERKRRKEHRPPRTRQELPQPPAPLDEQAAAIDALHAALDLVGAAGRQAAGAFSGWSAARSRRPAAVRGRTGAPRQVEWRWGPGDRSPIAHGGAKSDGMGRDDSLPAPRPAPPGELGCQIGGTDRDGPEWTGMAHHFFVLYAFGRDRRPAGGGLISIRSMGIRRVIGLHQLVIAHGLLTDF